jgi:hypothetical protein
MSQAVSMTEKQIALVGWVIAVALLGGTFLLQSPWNERFGTVGMVWIALCLAYSWARNSKTSELGLVKNVLVAALVIGALSLVSEGRPSLDEDGFAVVEGYDATFDQQAAAGVRTFLKVLVGGWLGVRVAVSRRRAGDPVKPKRPKTPLQPTGGD